MKQLALILFFALTASAQFTTFPPSGGVGVGAPNPYTYTAGASTSSVVDITSLNAANDRSLIAQCWTASGPVTITSWSTGGGPPLTTATLNYSSTSGVTCKVNYSGGAGAPGATGATGAAGAAASIAVGTVTTGAAGSAAAVTNAGTSSAAVLNFTIPQGVAGATGAAGSAATVTVGTVNTGAAGSSATVTNSGSSSAAVLNFSIPQGIAGPAGAANVTGSMTSATSVTITHSCGTAAVMAEFYDASGGRIFPATDGKTDTNTYYATFSPAVTGTYTVNCSGGPGSGGGGSMTYPGAGVPNSTGSAWGTSYTVGTAANNLVQLNSSGQLPAVSAANLTNFPTLNQSTSGNAATATALAATPTKCSAGYYPLGVDAQGNAQNCTAAASGGGGGAVYPIVFAGETTLTVTAATHGLGTTPVPAGGCRRTSDGEWPDGWKMTTNSSGDITIVPSAGAAFTGTCYVAGTAGGNLVLTDPALVPTRITGTASLSFSTFGGTGNCEEQNITVAGAAAGDVPTVSLPTPFPAGLVASQPYVSTTNTVTLRICRLAGTNTISSQTFNAQIVRGM